MATVSCLLILVRICGGHGLRACPEDRGKGNIAKNPCFAGCFMMVLFSFKLELDRRMAVQLILSFIANDRPGLVDQLSAAVTETGGNWLESRMAHMAEKFAGIARIEYGDRHQAHALKARLAALEAEGIRVSIDEARQERERESAALVINLVGPDHPGIVHDVTHCLATRRVSIETMDTHVIEAPMGGGVLFHAHMEVRCPLGLDENLLRDELEQIAGALMVDLSIQKT
jgi:glycine cleavage system regulatory protein